MWCGAVCRMKHGERPRREPCMGGRRPSIIVEHAHHMAHESKVPQFHVITCNSNRPWCVPTHHQRSYQHRRVCYARPDVYKTSKFSAAYYKHNHDGSELASPCSQPRGSIGNCERAKHLIPSRQPPSPVAHECRRSGEVKCLTREAVPTPPQKVPFWGRFAGVNRWHQGAEHLMPCVSPVSGAPKSSISHMGVKCLQRLADPEKWVPALGSCERSVHSGENI